MKLSVVIPCYNQGRFLTDCLESLAVQTTPPWEVVVVDDGSTDDESARLCARLPGYHYPFSVRSLRKPNGGLPSARNHGVRACRGDVILPLDADDKLAPDGIREYGRFLADNPSVDICYPDFQHFGNDFTAWLTPPFNRWRLTQQNFMAPSCAVRRRVIDAGYWYDEEMRFGYEDWEFWLRTCVLGPFRAAPLGKAVFVYRKWGYSMVAAVDHEKVIASFRAKHRAQGIWSAEIERTLRTSAAPSHRLVSGGRPPAHTPSHDMAALPVETLDHFLKTDHVSRFVWFGSFPPEATAHLQLIVNEVARHSFASAHPVSAYLFVDALTSAPFLAVLDRLAAFAGVGFDGSSPTPFPRVLTVTTLGDRQPRLVSLEQRDDQEVRFVDALAPLRRVRGAKALPVDLGTDTRADADMSFYLHREPAVPRPVSRTPGGRVLAIAMPWLTYGGAEFAMRILLEEGANRAQYDKIFILTFEKDDHGAHPLFERLTDKIYHLGSLPADDERRMAIALDMLESGGVTDFFINNSRHGYDLIPRIRKAGLAIRIGAQLHSLGAHPLVEGYPRELASRHANLVDRVVSVSDQITSFMVDHLYFPRHKIKTVRLGVDQRRFRPQEHAHVGRPKRIVWCGRLSPEKDPLLALRVAEHFHARDRGVRFLFIGDGPEAEAFAERLKACRARGLPAEWVPRCDRVDQVLQESGCLFLTSAWEGIPIVAMEALSTGVPVVMCYANTAMAEIATPGQCFEVANRHDLDEYCRRLREALAAPRFTPDPALSHHRYAREMIDWLFPAGAGARKDYLTSVFGVTAAA